VELWSKRFFFHSNLAHGHATCDAHMILWVSYKQTPAKPLPHILCCQAPPGACANTSSTVSDACCTIQTPRSLSCCPANGGVVPDAPSWSAVRMPTAFAGHPLRVLDYQGTGPRLRLPRLYLDDPDMAYPCPTHRSSIVAVVGARDVWEADAAIFYECLRRQEGSSSRLERRLRRGGQALARTYEMSAQLERCHVQTTVCHPAAVLPILVCCSKRLSASVSDRSSSRFGCDLRLNWLLSRCAQSANQAVHGRA